MARSGRVQVGPCFFLVQSPAHIPVAHCARAFNSENDRIFPLKYSPFKFIKQGMARLRATQQAAAIKRAATPSRGWVGAPIAMLSSTARTRLSVLGRRLSWRVACPAVTGVIAWCVMRILRRNPLIQLVVCQAAPKKASQPHPQCTPLHQLPLHHTRLAQAGTGTWNGPAPRGYADAAAGAAAAAAPATPAVVREPTYALLSSGARMPMIGFGTYKVESAEVVKQALELGYRHFDCATSYQNQVGAPEVPPPPLGGALGWRACLLAGLSSE